MTNHKRGFAETNYAILFILGRDGPLKLTHLMYRVNVNSKIIGECTGVLEAAGYVKFEKRRFSLSSKGVMFLHFAQEFFMLQYKSVVKDCVRSDVLVK